MHFCCSVYVHMLLTYIHTYTLQQKWVAKCMYMCTYIWYSNQKHLLVCIYFSWACSVVWLCVVTYSTFRMQANSHHTITWCIAIMWCWWRCWLRYHIAKIPGYMLSSMVLPLLFLVILRTTWTTKWPTCWLMKHGTRILMMWVCVCKLTVCKLTIDLHSCTVKHVQSIDVV